MSADNWTDCPRCTKRIFDARETRIKEVRDSYGKVSADVFVANLAEAEAMPKGQDEDNVTLREDYGLGITPENNAVASKLFYVTYSAYCTVCKWVFKYKYEEKIDVT
jgi:hypothetical protein